MTPEKEISLEQAQKDYYEYLKECDRSEKYQYIVNKSFKEMFGYEIFLLEEGGIKIEGERFKDID